MYRITVSIKGMHCGSCEQLVAEKLRELPEVKRVKVSQRKGSAEIFSEKPLNMSKVNRAINEAG